MHQFKTCTFFFPMNECNLCHFLFFYFFQIILYKNLFRAFNIVPQAHWSTFSCGTGLKCFLICIFLTWTIGVGFFYMITTLISAISSTSIVKLSLVVISIFFWQIKVSRSLWQFCFSLLLKLFLSYYFCMICNFVSICYWNY